ncbi:hypothetical protein I4J10_04585 [Corynebacterium diphtheriae bv. mitis]|uniref:hypothetical protein n=1 Tax=Corynebacterium diphtheriae TaxID=1717 RepID=UPI0013C59FDF|nr:hypothetical protein [Corynebacterium diphtheriae]MBG9276482.1 hypothetical protein [Corynebacterium diphtheriae bv. mitis]MBG9280744.1 hypothetical protein [Corynebacterium diphtheriae bv. mitis]CAB0919621.1 hypothetical protein FRC0425_02205 [Corynebacterium diphtheriae]
MWHIREIRDPPLIGALNLRPSPLNTIRETLRGGISNGGACGLASEYTRDSKDIHEALHLVTSDGPACLVVMSRDVVLAPARNDTVPIQEVSVQTACH